MSNRRTARIMIAGAVLALLALPTLADEPSAQTPVDPPVVASPPAMPDLEINQAEIQAGVEIVPTAAVVPTPPARALSPMMVEIEAALAAGDAAVAALAERAAQAADETSQQAIMAQIAGLKQATELTILGIQADHARRAGNDALAAQINADMNLITNPPAPVPPTTPRPVPANER
jgi:hypothetical protein